MKLSPLSIVYRTLQRGSTILFLGIFGLSAGGASYVGGRVVVFAIVAVAVLATVGYELAYFRRFEYELTADTFDIRSGVISRREREIPYHRIQNVDISRNVLQRVLGIAAVGLETAGGRQTEGTIRYVSFADAEWLQREIQRRKQSTSGSEARDEEMRAVDAETLYRITPRELTLVGIFSFDSRIVGGAALLVSGSVPVLSQFVPDPMSILLSIGAVIIVVGLVLLSWLLGIVVAFVNYYGFRLTKADDELRYERGLFRRFSGSIPFSKIQTVTIEDNPLKRRFGYATLTVETAGYAPGQGGGGSQAAVPIAKRDRVLELANAIEPFEYPEFTRPPRRIRRRYTVRYLIAIGGLLGIGYGLDWYIPAELPWLWVLSFVVVVPAMAHYKWKHRGYALGGGHVVTQNGFWRRSTTVVPYYRIQTVIETRTVFQRRWGVATVLVDTAGTSSLLGGGAAAIDIETDTAAEIREELNDKLQVAITERQRNRLSTWLGSVDAGNL